ncbi:hypothetical protein [Altererythrobacter lutimaris]|uniref:Uncharacterized protein n=1 Tax=Altererythrobacter lutimaris TaxID=2743979 RepID=A0A850H749_9SPHN|nr:hypothetical protein [Altererythrobacter lutimaris]NVE93390.1 hypothetical protein [Altererythrobacter lutimaris]
MTVVSLDEFRSKKANRKGPAWKDSIKHCCAYANVLKAEHALEREQIKFDLLSEFDDCAWWDAPEYVRQRVEENNTRWTTYVALCEHIAALPARTRAEAGMKRSTIGKMWLKPDGTFGAFQRMRAGCLADDHLFPPSLKLSRVKGSARVSSC